MSINPVGGAAAAAGNAAAPAANRPEATETPGAPDLDHDGDNAAARTPAAGAPAAATVNVKA